MNRKKVSYAIILFTVIGIGFTACKMILGKNEAVDIKTERITRANISNTVTATGTLEASVTVEVGTQVSGKINKLYADYNSKVHKGQLIALLDTEALQSTLESSKATLDLAYAEFEFQKKNYERNQQLIDKKLIAQKDFEEVEYSYKSSLANLNSAKAKYSKDKTNLEYAYIYSPIDGIVLEKNVEEGETVAASFETPTLFTIANDLTQMEIEADVDEADIGQVKVGQRVEFTVDAFPDLTFNGKVVAIHLMPVESSNVITYTVIIKASNPEQILMPGMTANVTFFVTEKNNILVVPNKALAFSPDKAVFEAYEKENRNIKIVWPMGKISNPEKEKVVWIKSADSIYPQVIQFGETDEINYEVLSGIEEGTEVIISMTSLLPAKATEENSSEKSPFMPTPPGQNKKK